MTHEIVDEPLDGFDNLATPRLDDFLVVLSPDGEELSKISLIRAVASSAYQHLLHTVSSYAVADPLHTNTVAVITDETAARFPFGEAGQVLRLFRELGAIGVLDPHGEKFVWAAGGPWIGQHDPDLLPTGNILLFDNYGNFAKPEGRSRVIEFDPETMAIVWQYAGSAETPLESAIRSSQQRLANGNTLITESSGGRNLEVTGAGDIVCWTQRLDANALDPMLVARDPSPMRKSNVSEGGRTVPHRLTPAGS